MSLLDSLPEITNIMEEELLSNIKEYGLYNKYTNCLMPTGSISYIANATASIQPIIDKVEIRKEGNSLGRIYYPAPYLNKETEPYYKSVYDIDQKKIVDLYVAVQKYIDQGISLTLHFYDSVTTADINRIISYAYKSGIKTLYYVRLKKINITECESCQL